MKVSRLWVAGAAAMSFFAANIASGATDGTLGTTSSGTVDIQVIKGETAMVSGLADFNLGLWSPGDGDVTTQQNVCVYANDPGGDYFVTAFTGSGPGLGNEFRLNNGGGSFIHYQVGWTDATGSNFAGSTAVAGGGPLAGHGVQSVNQDTADQVSTSCGGGTTATLSMFIASAGANGLDAAPEGTYTDTLTITIEPN